jgi:magnesium chelatase family protein
MGLLLAHGLTDVDPKSLTQTAFLGELALDGSLRHVTGVLPCAAACKEHGVTRLVVPAVNGPEAALIPGLEVIAVQNLIDLFEILAGHRHPPAIAPHDALHTPPASDIVDFADIRGQEHAKRALEIAAAGGHNVLLSGAPGAGKTLLARALRGILPPLTREESIEVTQIYSVANLLPPTVPLITHRPFRVVHHTASGVSIVGGGQVPGPGEITLAHRGVLFLDELAEFPAQVLEVLRQPIEDRTITITRAQGSVTFPADFVLVAAMNPPEFTGGNPRRVQRRISAPLLDRIDLTIDVRAVPIEDLQCAPERRGEESHVIAARVAGARQRQRARFKNRRLITNREMGVREIDEFCPLDAETEQLLLQAVHRLKLSARGYHRTIKVARTIADLAGSDTLKTEHVAEALQYRQSIGIE